MTVADFDKFRSALGVGKDYHLTDLGNARRLVDQFGDRIRYVPEWGWLVFDGRRWARDRGEVEQFGKDSILGLYSDLASLPDAERSRLRKHAERSEGVSRIHGLVRLAETESAVLAEPDQFDRDPFALNCLNGTF